MRDHHESTHHDLEGSAPVSGRLRAVCLTVGPLAGLAAWWLLGPGVLGDGAPEPARRAAGLVVLMAVWWLTEGLPLAVTSLLPLILAPLLGILPLAEAASPYAHRLIFLFMGGFILALAMEKWHLHRRIAMGTVTLVGTHPSAIVLGFMTTTAFLSAWMSNAATAVLMLPIGMSIIRLFEERTGKPAGNFGLCLLLGIAYAASIGGVATPIGSPPNGIALAFIKKTYGIEVSFFEWLMFALPYVLAFIPLGWLVMTRLVYPIGHGPLEGGRETLRAHLGSMGRMSRGEKLVLTVFGLAITGWLIREPLRALAPSLGPFIRERVDDTSVALAAALLLFALPVDLKRGEFVMDWKTAARMPWEVLLLFGGGLSLAACIQESGLDHVIGDAIGGMGGLPAPLILVIIIAVAVFMSEITSNTAQANIFVPIVAVIAASVGMDPLLMLIPVTFALSCAFMMPMGTPPNALVFSSGRVTIRQMARAGLVLNLLTITLATLMAYTVVPWALGAR